MKYSIDKWSLEFPTAENKGQWFFVKTLATDRITFKEVRVNIEGRLFLSGECNSGIQETSYGTDLLLFKKDSIAFSGPIQTPPGFRE